MNLLIVEDNASNQYLTNMLMEYWGYNSDIATNGKDAVELATELQPEVKMQMGQQIGLITSG